MAKENEIMKEDELEAILKDLPKEKLLLNKNIYVFKYQGFWIPRKFIRGVIYAQQNYVARDDDIIVASCPKSGATWLKSLIFLIVHRSRFSLKDSPLLKLHAHEAVPILEDFNFWMKCNDQSPNFETVISQPRLIHTHLSYQSLPHSIKTSNAKIIYISRNPLDQFVSYWHFVAKANTGDEFAKPDSLQESFDKHCCGIFGFGPLFDHVLGFWKESLEYRHKVLFLKFEDLKTDPIVNVKRLAEFLGFPFSEEEEKEGLIDEILEFCSIERMRNLEVNKCGDLLANGSPRKYFSEKVRSETQRTFSPLKWWREWRNSCMKNMVLTI